MVVKNGFGACIGDVACGNGMSPCGCGGREKDECLLTVENAASMVACCWTLNGSFCS